MKNIAVIGRHLTAEKFEIVFDMLEDGVEAGKIQFAKFAPDGHIPYELYDGYIYLVTTPKQKDKPFIHILATEDEDSMVEKVQELGGKLNESSVDNSTPSSSDVTPSLSSVKVSIKGRDVELTKEDLDCIKALMGMCGENDLEIKEVIVN